MLHVTTPNGTRWAVDTLYVKRLSGAQGAALEAAGLVAKPISDSGLLNLLSAVGVNTGVPATGDPVYAAPLTVEGASEDFITGQLQQVLNSFGSQTNTINANVVIMRDQVKAHVTSEADRVIASS
jgi:hypothetical protein